MTKSHPYYDSCNLYIWCVFRYILRRTCKYKHKRQPEAKMVQSVIYGKDTFLLKPNQVSFIPFILFDLYEASHPFYCIVSHFVFILPSRCCSIRGQRSVTTMAIPSFQWFWDYVFLKINSLGVWFAGGLVAIFSRSCITYDSFSKMVSFK